MNFEEIIFYKNCNFLRPYASFPTVFEILGRASGQYFSNYLLENQIGSPLRSSLRALGRVTVITFVDDPSSQLKGLRYQSGCIYGLIYTFETFVSLKLKHTIKIAMETLR